MDVKIVSQNLFYDRRDIDLRLAGDFAADGNVFVAAQKLDCHAALGIGGQKFV